MYTGKKRQNKTSKNAILVSVIIPTKDSSASLPMCLKSIYNQTYKNIEVIVVDNYSKDDTRSIAKSYGARVYLCGPERSVQKNYGAKVARGDFLYFVDSDFILSRNVVSECVDIVLRGYDAVVVPNLSYPRTSFVARIRFLERLTYIDSTVFEAARFIRRDLFFKVGGFDESLYANEDYDLHIRLLKVGARIGRCRNSFEIHIGEPRSFKEFFIKNIYYGKNLRVYLKKHCKEPVIAHHVSPIRFTFLQRGKLALICRDTVFAPYLIFLVKFLQLLAALLSIIL